MKKYTFDENYERPVLERGGGRKFRPIEYVKENSCWNQISHRTDRNGYARIMRNSNLVFMHRYIYEIVNNVKIQENNVILHSCDNPRCINPDHLSEGTVLQNIQDRQNKGRQTKGEGHPCNTKLTEEDVIQIKKYLRDKTYNTVQLGKMYNVPPGHISNIKNGKKWKHVII